MLERPEVKPVNGEKPAPELYRPLPKPVVVNVKTPSRVRKAVADAIARQNRAALADDPIIKVGDDWDGMGHRALVQIPDDLRGSVPEPGTRQEVVHPMGRRKQAKSATDDGSFLPPQMRIYSPPKISTFAVIRRLGVWFGALISFQMGNWWDVVRGRDSEARRAVRLREMFEHVGGTFVKIGQQMASRLDVLPQRYCQELATMLDSYPPFPTEQAIAIIERTTGQRLEEIFSEFDPEPIGSASIAVVYQARLRLTGEKVAVKVRRPGINQLFEADFRAIDLLGGLAETLTLVRPHFTEGIRHEFRMSLSSELDFRREGRLGELFRRRAKKTKERFFTAPRVIAEYTNEEVLVQEFVSGMWLWEILAAVERNDSAALARMQELNLDPKIIARRLLYTHNWGLYSHIAFHADPHPANIVVRANNELVFVDFGAAGYINNTRKLLLQRSFDAFLKDDVETIAQVAVMINEPLPPMDVNAVIKDTEVGYYNHMLAIKSKNSPWYERTTASMFIAMINIIGRHNLPAPHDILMFTRATLLYDTLAARLNPKINFYKEYQRYGKRAAKRTAKKARKSVWRRLRRGFTDQDYVTLENLLETGGELMFKAQRLMSIPYDFAVLPFVVEKWSHTAMMLTRFFVRAAIVTALGVGIVALTQPQDFTLENALKQVMTYPLYLVIVAWLVFQHSRLIWFRLGDKTRADM
jgi:ubiquinone biosynthesis protein